MKNVLADQRSSQKNSLESEGQSRQDIAESNRVAPPQPQANDWPYHRWTKGDQHDQSTSQNGYKHVPQQSYPVRQASFWERIPQGAIEGAKLAAFSVVAMGLTVVVLQELSPSPQKQPIIQTPLPSKPTPPLVPKEMPTSAVPEQLSPSSQVSPLPQFSPLPEVPLPNSLTPSTSLKSKDLPVLQNASPGNLPIPNATKLKIQPSSPGNGSVIPPSLPADIPLKPPCPEQATNPDGTPAAEHKAKSDKNSTALEVKNYFNKHWQRPTGLTQTLEYSLVLNKDGNLERISPLSNAAAKYIDQANMPLPDSQLISPRKEEGKTNIHLVLSPDGKVKAELE